MKSIKCIEDDLEKSLLQTVKIKRVEDISQCLLKQSNKDVLIRLVNTLSGALSRSQEMLKTAAVHVDNLKSENILCQKELLGAKDEILCCKNEQLSAVKNTVASEMRSWSDVVKENCVQSSSVSPMKIKEAVKSAVSEEDKLHNVMVFGLNELDEDDVHDAEDEGLVDEMMEQLNICPKRVVQIDRVGERREGYIRPMKFRMERKDFVLEVLARSRRLKDTERFSNVYLAPDRTREERSAHKELVEQLKKRRAEFPESAFYIRGNKICKKARTDTNA